uniref:U-box domain-containing protein n=1 Tax=Chromera velia CCMP2878 TaxID=1169474 RepID=A0A0G4G837_9ALVE|mmetsp:Transcript_7966/g.15531  ORF Transcript_7966/g.15531 Transcript_7966/m.15531 type:complete len:372 (-) Transcript_7966:257-1372(-)|eukprot:Cvel_4308.t1-p1 / transcript=Cvel_4308.t1 / gene=Cvel_4308 / organism=Chromera_velia_CCMP2878 / gene_product=WD repeat, SAM and U-box domain-containing protein, putative / transcript_product=WD repeat, SAM and U-box domain-containing protein, putative / location=Cvel_scaffold187:4246-7658(-) / protein_length=371 / sequence_SO=supercontig / SO=protein_coding / is_pseudo=false
MTTVQAATVLDGFVCPITGIIMRDPVVTVDGHSYERTAISAWFDEGKKTSPASGATLPSSVLLPNHALRYAIEHFLDMNPQMRNFQAKNDTTMPRVKRNPYSVNAGRYDVAGESFCFLNEGHGDCVEVKDFGRIAQRWRESPKMVDTVVFIAQPLRQMPSDPVSFSFRVLEHVTAMSGMLLGLSPEPLPAILKKEDTDLEEYIKGNCWYIDQAGWLFRPYETGDHLSWNIADLRAQDLVCLTVTEDGSLVVEVNDEVKTKYPAKIPTVLKDGSFQEMYGFMSITGNVKAVELVAKRASASAPSAPSRPAGTGPTVIHIRGGGGAGVAIHSQAPPDYEQGNAAAAAASGRRQAPEPGEGGCGCFAFGRKSKK